MPLVDKKVIGRVEKVAFPELGYDAVYARIDTGAKTSSIWASATQVTDGVLEVVFFGKDSPHYTGKVEHFNEFAPTVVVSSTGHAQERYKVRLLVKLKNKNVRAWFTLADRSTQVYPVLIGRNVLRGKFVVDVKKGQSLKAAEQKRTQSLRIGLDKE